MRVIYEPTGAAREYADLACNLRLGCTHGCNYCYCPGVVHKTRADFYRAVPARANIIENLRHDAGIMAAAGDKRRVHFCFVGDPYDEADLQDQTTRRALEIMVINGLRFQVLTKGGMRALRDAALVAQGGTFGTSLVWPGTDWLAEEPGAAPPGSRLKAINTMTCNGIYCWASVEPVPASSPSVALNAIEDMHLAGVREVRVGIDRRNGGDKWASTWEPFCEALLATCRQLDMPYQIKASLAPFWPEGVPLDTREPDWAGGGWQ